MSFHHDTLPNGLRVVAELDDRAHSVAAGFFVRAGSRDEVPAEAGVSHFLEHMVFKGTPRRDALAVNRDFDRVGAKHNAQTSEEDTVYHVTCLPEYLPPAFDVLADLMRPTLAEADFATEKQVILEEIRMYQDSALSVAYEAAKAAHFAPHPLGQSILGTAETVGGLGVDAMRRYFAARYAPGNLVLAVAGKTSWDEILRLANERCGGWEVAPAPERALVEPRGNGSFGSLSRPDDQQQTIVAVLDAPSLESPDRYAAALLATMLGDHTGSRLYWELIDPGHADGAEASYQDYNGAGAYYLLVTCDPDEAQANLGRLADACKKLQIDGPGDAELARAKNKVLARSVIRSERPMGRLMALGFHWAYRGEYYPIDRELEQYAAVGPTDLRRVLDRYPLWPATIVTAGPRTDLAPPG